MYTTLLRSLATGGGTVALTIGMATAAVAGPPFTVTVAGSSASSTYSTAGISTGAVTVDVASCGSVIFDGTVHGGSISSSPYTIADVSTSTWNNCAVSSIPLTVTQSGTWHFNATSGPASGVTTGTLTGVSAHVADTASGGSLCSFDLVGNVPATFTNSTQILAMSGNSLSAVNVVGCFGLVGGPTSLSAGFHLIDPTTVLDYPVVIS